MHDTYLLIVRLLLDGVGLILIAFILYVIVYYIKKYALERWVIKAVNAAEILFDTPDHTLENSQLKKDWVLSFLKDNGLTEGVSDAVVEMLIESAVNTLNMQKASSNNGGGILIK